MKEKQHPFLRTLGEGPYKFLGTFDLGAVMSCLSAGNVSGYNNGMASAPRLESGMGTCTHCGHAITFICIVSNKEGKKFGVGSDCIAKVELPYEELSAFKRAKLSQDRKLRLQRKTKKAEAARFVINQTIESNKEFFKSIPHPSRKDSSFLDYLSWCLKNSSDGGIVFVLKKMNKELEKAKVL